MDIRKQVIDQMNFEVAEKERQEQLHENPDESTTIGRVSFGPTNPTDLQPLFEVYLISGNDKRMITFDQNESTTVDALMHQLYNENREFFKGQSFYDLEFYIANKRGEPKDDYPAVDKNQILSMIKFTRFVMIAKEAHNPSFAPLKSIEEEQEVCCFCFRKPKAASESYTRIN